MPRPRSAMRKIRQLLRLHRGEGLSRRQAAVAAGLPYATAADHLARAERAGLGWPLPEDLDDAAEVRRAARWRPRTAWLRSIDGRRARVVGCRRSRCDKDA